MSESKETPTQIDSAELDADNELINRSDFSSIELKFQITNGMTKITVADVSNVQVVELLEKGMVLELPARSCAKGHSLSIKISTKNCKEDLVFPFTCIVEEVASDQGLPDKITILLRQFEETDWLKFQGIFSNRQSEILEFLKSARGW